MSASEPEKNEIVFYYTKNIVVNAYEINYYFENESGEYTVDETKKITGSGNAGNQILANTPIYEGYTLNNKMGAKSGIISGTENTKLNLQVYYSKNKYTITYDPNNKVTNNKTISQEVFHNGQISVIENSYTAENHYHFFGWNTNKDGSGTDYKANDTIQNIIDNLKLYAIWEEDTKYEVTYNVNGGMGSVNDNQMYYQGDEVTVKDITGVKAPEGKKFSGWTMDGIALFKDDKFTIQKDTELVASWIDKTKYTITYHGNGGDLVDTQKTQYSFYEDVNASIAPNMFDYPGYKFKHWCISPDGKGTTYTQPQNVNPFTGNLDLYAIWTKDNDKWVEVAYDTNGGIGTITSDYNKEYLKGSNVTILDKTDDMSRNQAIFLGWTVNKTNLITQKADVPNDADLYVKDEVYAEINRNLSLYAVWAIDTDEDGTPDYDQFSLKYDVNGGTPELFDTNFYQVNETAILKNAISKTSRVFLGWTVEDLNDVMDADQLKSITIYKDTYTMIKDTTLHAVWAADKDEDGTPDYAEYKVVYNKNADDAVGTMVDEHLYSGKVGDNSVTLKNNEFVRSGYEFVGWSTTKEDMVNLIQPGSSIPVIDKSITLYAQWKKLYTIEFKAGEHGQLQTDKITFNVKEGTAWSESGVVPPSVKANFGYQLKESQNWDKPFPASIETNYVFTAQYEIKEEDWATVGYELNGGSGTAPIDTNSPYLKGGDVIILDKTNNMDRDKAFFLGWSKEPMEVIREKKNVPDEASLFVAGETYTEINNGLTLYAVWAIDTDEDGTPDYEEFQIKYEKNAVDATGVTVDNIFYSGKQGEVSATIKENGFTREGYVFAGWRSTTDTSGALLLPKETMQVSENITLYAQWIKLMNVSATPYEGPYTGKSKGIELTGVPKNATIYYSLSKKINAENYLSEGTQILDLKSIDNVVDANNYNVYYYVIADNYVPFEGFEVVKINKVKLAVIPTALPKTIQYGDNLPAFGVQISGFVNEENRDKVSGIDQLQYESTYTKGSKIGDYTVSITADSFEKLTAKNYIFEKGTELVRFAVVPKTITVSIDEKVLKVYDGTNGVPDLTGRFLSNDILDSSEIKYQSAEFNSPDVNTAKYVTVFGLTAGENYSIALNEGQDGVVFTAEITARPITITAGSATRTFNNQPLTQTSSAITTGDLVESHFYEAITSGSITNPGTTSNTITEYRIYSLNESETIEIDETDNYNVSLIPGTLIVNAVPATDGGQEPTAPTPTPTTPPTTTITPEVTATAATLPPSNIVIDEAPVALAARPTAVTPVEPTVVEEEVVAADDDVTIEEEETPLADKVTEIEEEETPLAVPVDNCMIHWLILILTAAYAVYEIVRGFARKKKINELTDSESFSKSDANA